MLLEAVTRAPLTLVQAPMGAGKSAAASLTFDNDDATTWMDAQPWHRAAFATALVDAVRTRRPDFGRMTLGAFEAGAHAQRLGHLFAAELGHVDRRLILIIDNAQVLAGNTAFTDFLNAAVEELPTSARILVLGRAVPQIAPSRILAAGVTMLDGRFLALDRDELHALATTFGRTLADDEAEAIVSATEGWVAGAALALAGWNEPDLAANIFAEIGKEHARTLEELSVFQTIDVHALQKHDAFSNIGAALAEMRARGAPIDPIAGGSYRVHPLLRNLARERLRARGGEIDAQRRAVEIRARGGHIAAALHHADAAADSTTAGAFLRTHAQAAIATGDRERVRSLTDRIDATGPDADVRAYAEGLLDKAAASAQARTAFARAAQEANASGDEPLAFNARVQTLEYDIGHSLRVDDAALDDLQARAASLGPLAQVAVAVLRGWARAVAFDFAAALRELPVPNVINDVITRFNVSILRAYAQTALGEIDAAQDTLDDLTRLLEDDDRAVLQTLTLVWFARLALLWGRTNAAAEAGEHAARLAAALDLRAEEAALYIALAEIAAHTGDVAGAVRFAQRAREHADRAWYAADIGRVRALSEIVLARAAFLGHDNAIALDLVRRTAAQRDTPPVQRAVALTEAAYYTLLSDPPSAAQFIARASEAIAQAQPIDAGDAVALAVADDLLAFLAAANGEPYSGLGSVSSPFSRLIEQRRGLVSLELAGVAVGNARRGAAEGTTAFETAIDTLTREGPRFEARLIRAYAATFLRPKQREPRAAASIDLTARESEILALLVEGLSNKEIAQRLVVSPRTIETHVERVLGKLEVGSRSRAIARALRLGLVALD
ncbi:MAG TPA: response regulator transcription factor [Candidatus Acidoferrum sp.]|nr:response regulator transcription factor [Candidatus Acidoferrum sp.]